MNFLKLIIGYPVLFGYMIFSVLFYWLLQIFSVIFLMVGSIFTEDIGGFGLFLLNIVDSYSEDYEKRLEQLEIYFFGDVDND